jgi:hypothetical protein
VLDTTTPPLVPNIVPQYSYFTAPDPHTLPFYNSSSRGKYQTRDFNCYLPYQVDEDQNFCISRVNDEVQARVRVLESEFSNMITGLEYPAEMFLPSKSRHDITYEADTLGERFTCTEANVDVPSDCSVSRYLSRHSISKENFKPRMGGTIQNAHVPLTSQWLS